MQSHLTNIKQSRVNSDATQVLASSPKDVLKSTVFSCCRKGASDCSSLTKDGVEFQALAAAAGNARSPRVRIKVKVKVGFLYSATYTRRTRTTRFTISEVAVDWQEPVVLRRYAVYPLPALTDIGPAAAASEHTTAPINHTRPSPS